MTGPPLQGRAVEGSAFFHCKGKTAGRQNHGVNAAEEQIAILPMDELVSKLR